MIGVLFRGFIGGELLQSVELAVAGHADRIVAEVHVCGSSVKIRREGELFVDFLRRCVRFFHDGGSDGRIFQSLNISAHRAIYSVQTILIKLRAFAVGNLKERFVKRGGLRSRRWSVLSIARHIGVGAGKKTRGKGKSKSQIDLTHI